MKYYKLKFSYKAFRADFPVFDFETNEYISFDDCIKKYGEDAAKNALDNPGRVVEAEEKKERTVMIHERMIKA